MLSLESEIDEIINELGVKVIDVPEFDADGCYIAALDTIVLDGRLSPYQRLSSLLHELGHACKHHDDYHMYNAAYSLHSKMEKDAEEFMIEKMIEVRTEDPDFNLVTFNSINFLESYDLDMKYEPVVKEFMTNYFVSRNMNTIFF